MRSTIRTSSPITMMKGSHGPLRHAETALFSKYTLRGIARRDHLVCKLQLS